MVSKIKSLKFQLIKDKILSFFSREDREKLPSERELCELFKVSRTTIRKALAELEKSRLISRKVGSGTFIISKKRSQLIWFLCVGTPPQLLSFFEREINSFMNERYNVDIRLLHIDARRLADEIRVRTGIKIILAPNFGYLIATRMLFPLNEMEDFTDCLSYINSNYIEWYSSAKERKSCYSIPLFVDTEVFAVNVKLAEELGIPLPPIN
ncbi:MAG TPA: GntR family transcriptional regulator, partial [Victivallales bacterium]|nr:GntR family transcriptional regulator [Victivallales bacterium]